MKRAAIIILAVIFGLAVISDPTEFGVGALLIVLIPLVWIFLISAPYYAGRWWWRRGASGLRDTFAYVVEPKQHGPTTLPPPPRAGDRCPLESNKVVFATRGEAQRSVENSQLRFTTGQVATPLDHEYQCPHYDHWHVSSKPQRW